MIRILAVLAAITVLLLIVYQRDTEQPAQASDQRIETGWSGFDSLIDDNLSDGTQDTLASSVSESADVLRGWGSSMVDQVQGVAERR